MPLDLQLVASPPPRRTAVACTASSSRCTVSPVTSARSAGSRDRARRRLHADLLPVTTPVLVDAEWRDQEP